MASKNPEEDVELGGEMEPLNKNDEETGYNFSSRFFLKNEL